MDIVLGLTYAGEVRGELSLTALLGQLWAFPFLVFINLVDINSINKWISWAVMTALLCYPNGKISLFSNHDHQNADNFPAHPLQVGWASRNSNTVQSRTVSAALYNMSVQSSGIISSNIYREDDAPLYKRGNRQLLVILVVNVFLYLGTKMYYVWRNDSRDRVWNKMNDEERKRYVVETKDEGNKRLDFRFMH